jgi:hypothetical protein
MSAVDSGFSHKFATSTKIKRSSLISEFDNGVMRSGPGMYEFQEGPSYL